MVVEGKKSDRSKLSRPNSRDYEKLEKNVVDSYAEGPGKKYIFIVPIVDVDMR